MYKKVCLFTLSFLPSILFANTPWDVVTSRPAPATLFTDKSMVNVRSGQSSKMRLFDLTAMKRSARPEPQNDPAVIDRCMSELGVDICHEFAYGRQRKPLLDCPEYYSSACTALEKADSAIEYGKAALEFPILASECLDRIEGLEQREPSPAIDAYKEIACAHKEYVARCLDGIERLEEMMPCQAIDAYAKIAKKYLGDFSIFSRICNALQRCGALSHLAAIKKTHQLWTRLSLIHGVGRAKKPINRA